MVSMIDCQAGQPLTESYRLAVNNLHMIVQQAEFVKFVHGDKFVFVSKQVWVKNTISEVMSANTGLAQCKSVIRCCSDIESAVRFIHRFKARFIKQVRKRLVNTKGSCLFFLQRNTRDKRRTRPAWEI